MKILVLGAGGFIGHNLVKFLKDEGHYIVGCDLKKPEYENTVADEFYIKDLRIKSSHKEIVTDDLDQIYQLAADMGGAGYIFTGENDADIMHNSVSINLNILDVVKDLKTKPKILYTSSACIYPERNQLDPNNPNCEEVSAYPADPDSEYGWEKLFSERLYQTYRRNYEIDAKVVRLHNVFGPNGSWNNGKEKAPAALCRKVALANNEIEVWGPGNQTRSFLYIDECIQGLTRIMVSDITQPVNLGSERSISINDLAQLIGQISGKNSLQVRNIDGPVGVMGRTSHNKLIEELIGWRPSEDLEYGLKITYSWIREQIQKQKN